MAGIGIGRGRGRGIFMKKINGTSNNLDQRVGVPPVVEVKKDPLDEIISEVKKLRLDSNDQELKEIFKKCEKLSKKSEIQDIAQVIYNRCMADIEFIDVGISLFNILLPIECEQEKFRNCILNLIQRDFKERKKIHQSSVESFICLTTVLCQIFKTFRIQEKPLIALIAPVCDCLLQLSSGDLHEIETVSAQLQDCGQLLMEYNPERLKQLMNEIRKQIISSSKSEKCRCILMELVECNNHRWQHLPDELSQFYSDLQVDLD